MFERFTREARETVRVAEREARALGHSWLGTEHLLLALVQGEGVAARVLARARVTREGLVAEYRGMIDAAPDPAALSSLGIDLEEVRRIIEDAFGPGALEETAAWRRATRCSPGARTPRFTPRATRALELTLREAMDLGDRQLGTEHLLLALAREGEGLAARLLARRGLDHAVLRSVVADELRRSA